MEVHLNATNDTLRLTWAGFHTDTGKSIRFVFMLLVSVTIIVSNLINITILRTVKEIPKVSRIFLTNLSVADFSVGCFVCLPSVVSAFTGTWPYGPICCQISALIYTSSCSVSIWSIAFISIERYVAVVRPHKYKNGLSKKHCLLIIFLMWAITVSVFISPNFTKPSFIYYQYHDPYVMCAFDWEYSWLQIGTAIMFPYGSGLCILFCSRNTIKALGRTNPSRTAVLAVTEAGRQRNIGKEEKATRLIIITALCYFMCWGPICLFGSIILYVPNGQNLISPWVEFISIWIANCNSFMNVVIYSGIYPSFREAFRRLLCKTFTCSTSQNRREGAGQTSTISSTIHTTSTT